MSQGTDRRRHPRAEIEWPTKIRHDDLSVDGVTKNLSHSGALICCEQNLSPGERIRIAIMISDRLPLVVDAEVMRVNILSSDSTCGLFEIGVRFVAISAEDLGLIDLAVSAQIKSQDMDWRESKLQESNANIYGFAERRRFPRISADWSVNIEAPKGVVSGRTVDVSAGGAFICCKQPVKRSERFQMTFFDVPSLNRPLSVRAEVVRSDFYWAEDETLFYGIGVKFIDISDEDRALVLALTSTHFKPKSLDLKLAAEI